MSVLLSIYRGATTAARPLLGWHLNRRAGRGKEDPSRLGERHGIASRARPDGPLLWVHAASVGESLSALPLISEIRVRHPKVSVLMTTGTVTSAALIAKRAPDLIHQYVPLDTPHAVSRFFDHWQPSVALWMESELWPTLVTETQRRKIPAALVNGRLSKASARNWSFARGAARAMVTAFDLRLVQSEATRERLIALGAPQETTLVTGDLKASRPADPPDAHTLSALRTAIGSRPVWLAASTHPGEEEAVLKAHRALSQRAPDLLTIIAPRHPERAPEIAGVIEQHGLSVCQRSISGDVIDAPIYLADTLGEMPLWYALAPIAFVGAGWSDLGGHNPFEPAQAGAAVLSGPKVANFEQAYADLTAAGAARFVDDTDALVAAVLGLTDDRGHANAAAKAMGSAGAKAGSPDPAPLQKTMAALAPLLTQGLG